jgi:hypothetical protein
MKQTLASVIKKLLSKNKIDFSCAKMVRFELIIKHHNKRRPEINL